MPFRMAAYADEISTDIQVQMDYMLQFGIKLCALRSAHGRSILEWESFQIPLTKTQFNNRKIRFSSLSSPVGMGLVTDPFEPELEKLKLACARAKEVEAKVLGIFGIGVPAGQDPAQYQDEVVKRLQAIATYVKGEGQNLLLENAAGTYCDTSDRIVDVMGKVGVSNLMLSFDFASFVEAGEDPQEAWPKLKQWVRDFHVRDRNAEGQNVLPGTGAGHVSEILRGALENGWAGLITLEPGLKDNPEFAGVSPEKRFLAACEALAEVLKGLS